ncbi:GNAT family N-acetyltransferase [Sphaerisporangium aureirubrum]|uniref:GNAT family N-acetyltransferase n=1 Tax=Sphaerisporangium aureirubrum TaxID=1544736 RepID=A0ABW1NLV6_9ACTN
MDTIADRMAAAYFEAFEFLCGVTPKGWYAERGTARAAMTRAGLAILNAVYDTAREPDLGALDEVAAEAGRQGVPWSIMVRGEVSDEVAGLAARHGLVERGDLPFLVCAADDLVFRAGAGERKAVRRVGADESDLYTEALTRGFEVHEDMLDSLMGGGVLDAGPITGYLAEESGRAAGTGLGIRVPGAVGVFNIAVLPAARGRGLGRAVTEAVLRDGVAAGAGAAFLHASAMGLPLYESMGFRVVETWTVFRAR